MAGDGVRLGFWFFWTGFCVLMSCLQCCFWKLRGTPGRPGWSPTRAPHRSVLAQLTHTAPHLKPSLLDGTPSGPPPAAAAGNAPADGTSDPRSLTDPDRLGGNRFGDTHFRLDSPQDQADKRGGWDITGNEGDLSYERWSRDYG